MLIIKDDNCKIDAAEIAQNITIALEDVGVPDLIYVGMQ